MAAFLYRIKYSLRIFGSAQTPRLPTIKVPRQYVAQTKSEYLARMTPDVVVADWERRRMTY